MSVILDPKTKDNYIQRCLGLIKPLFPVGFYTDPESIEKCCNICLDFFISEFEIECKKIKTTVDVLFFINSYSDVSSNKEKYSTCDHIIYRKLCKYVFGEMTKLNIISSKTSNIDSTLISNLYYLTYLIDEYIQYLYTYYIVNKQYHQLEVYEEYFGIRTTDNEFANKLQEFKSRFDQSIYKKICMDDSEISKFREMAELAFGETAKAFWTNVFASKEGPVVIDLSCITFSDSKNFFDSE